MCELKIMEVPHWKVSTN